MARYLILGDLHAKWQDLNSVMKNVDFGLKIPYDAVIQVGDFGFYLQKFLDLKSFNQKPVKDKNGKYSYEYSPLKFHKKVYAIDGNHEDHEWLAKQDKEWMKETFNIHYQQRGSYLDIDGYKIGFIGGALNADKKQEGSIDKRTTNYILDKEIDETLASWNSIGGVDTIISHSCPTNIGIGMEGSAGLFMTVQKYIVDSGFGDNNFFDCGEHTLTRLYNGLEKKPSIWAYGHFHKYHQAKVGTTEFICVGSTDSSDNKHFVNPFILDTKKKTYEFHNKRAMNFTGEHCTWVVDDEKK